MSDAPEDRLAAELRRRRLVAPARLLLDAHRPLAPLLADAAAFAAPLTAALGGRLAGDVRALLADGDGPDRLLARLAADDESSDPCRTSES
jgi:hypothetical protein